MSDGIIDLSRQKPPADVSVEICIIGSGPGGATAARVLSEAGRDVLVLEEGGDYVGAQLNQRDGEMYDQLYMDRGGRTTDDLAVSVLQGRVLGGGSVINASDVVPIPDAVLEHWRRKHGLTEFTEENLAPFRARALEDLRAGPIPAGLVNPANRALRRGSEKIGWRGEVMHHNRVGCQGLGTCLIGCPVNAKQNARIVTIPRSLATGARYYIRARAVKIQDAGRELKRIQVRALDAKGYHEINEFEIRAKIVILAANAVGSAQLLLRSGIGNRRVGRNLMLQPQLPVVALFKKKMQAFRGIPQSYALTEFETVDPENGLGGFRVEGVMGTPGIVSTLLPYVGAENKNMMTLYPRLAGSLLLVPDLPSGEIDLTGSGRPLIRYNQREDHRARLRAAVKAAAEIYLAAGAESVIVPLARPLEIKSRADLSKVDELAFEPATAPLISAHQQGSLRFAPDANQGAAAPDGRVYETKDVYVYDSSGFPTSSSSHTMAPIMTISYYLSTRLLARIG